MMKNRREFLKSAGRNSVLVLAAGAGVLGFAFKKIEPRASGGCLVNPSCKACIQLASCGKPQATDYLSANADNGGK